MENALAEFANFISGAPQTIIAIILGVILLFFGYKAKRIAIAIIGFVVGWSIAAHFAPSLVADPFWQFVLKLAAGAILGVSAISLERLAVFIIVGFAFWSAAYEALAITDPMAHLGISVAIGVVAGVISVWLLKPMFIFASSIKGAQMISTMALTAFNIPTQPWALVLLVVLAAVGIIFQWKDCKHVE